MTLDVARARFTLAVVFVLSGLSALIYQSAWQRLLSLSAGMDLYSVTAVVGAFMAGLGLGNIAGGRLADRLSPTRSVVAYSVAEGLLALSGASSPWTLPWLSKVVAPLLVTPAWGFAFHFALLLVPTALMGATLPLLARGVVRHAAEIAPFVGRLYGVNALGAAAGALLMAGPWFLSHVGLGGALLIAAGLNVTCALGAFRLTRLAVEPLPADSSPPSSPAWGAMALYAVTGFGSLGLEVVWFRLLNVVGRSSTYTFSRLLFLYLVGLSVGSLVASRFATRLTRPARAFAWAQLGIAAWALIGPWAVVRYFDFVGKVREVPRDLLAPLVVLLVPTVLMGAAFVFMQRAVSQRVGSVGADTGGLLFANTVGCVVGTLVTAFVLLERWGTPRTLLVLASVFAAVGLWTVALERGPLRRLGALVLALGPVALGWAAFPQGTAFWAPLHGVPAAALSPREDAACMVAMVEEPGPTHTLFISGERQNGVPFDDFHVRLGTLPVAAHPQPRRVLVIGLGAGSTPLGVALDPRVERIDCVEICPQEKPLLEGLAGRGVREMQVLFADGRVRHHFQDGRRFLLDAQGTYDVIITDTLLTKSAYSGSLYSREFYALVASRLGPGGVFAQWVPSDRVYQTVHSVFPHVTIPTAKRLDGQPELLLASMEPLRVDAGELMHRLQSFRLEVLPAQQATELVQTAADLGPSERSLPAPSSADLNTDLFPRDEFESW